MADTLDRLLANANDQRVIIATFSSVLARLHEIMHLAQKHGRKVALTGRSLIENVRLARELGYMDIPDGLLVDVNERLPKSQDAGALDRLTRRAALGPQPDGERRTPHPQAWDAAT